MLVEILLDGRVLSTKAVPAAPSALWLAEAAKQAVATAIKASEVRAEDASRIYFRIVGEAAEEMYR